ncbi:MAG: methyl-accepting chemotaxis protein, partial [Sulfitobacter sp.]|nr:methyl-accepting chemotaxis protein [Sulfitobacter sp.]
MTAHTPVSVPPEMDKLAKTASALGFEIVDIGSFLDLLEGQADQQRSALLALRACATDMTAANADATASLRALTERAIEAQQDIQTSVALVREVGEKTRGVAVWVKSIRDRTESVGETLRAVRTNNSQIASIAAQVNTLAINAKIEAARAGDAGRGFAVVADAINALSQKTGTAAKQISENIEGLTGWIGDLGREAGTVAQDAETVLEQSGHTDTALSRMETTMQAERDHRLKFTQQTDRVKDAVDRLRPAVQDIETTVEKTSSGIESTNRRVESLIDTSEQIVQMTAGLGGVTGDARFIDFVQKTALKISAALEQAVKDGRITIGALFDDDYCSIPGTNPVQVTTRAVNFLDELLPDFQEPALSFDNKIVFCAAVNLDGYLPTHNRKFSQPQTRDVVWNTAHSRNRRIFDDRVGLKAGRSTAPFLLQVYRRDMGGGEYKIMKDLSSPIYV